MLFFEWQWTQLLSTARIYYLYGLFSSAKMLKALEGPITTFEYFEFFLKITLFFRTFEK